MPSSVYLLELTAKGASKGEMVQRLARRLNVSMENVYCVGDHANDLGMLALSAIPFAPENAIESVRQVPGIHILPDARHGAIAADPRAGSAVLRANWIFLETLVHTMFT